MLTDAEEVAGLLVVENDDGSVSGYEVNADVATPDGLAAMAAVAAEQGGSGGLRAGNSDAGPSLLFILGGALLGGLILNLMPCVFPVLSLKALSLTAKTGKEAKTVRFHGLLYTAGVIIAFLVLATVLLGLRAGGEAVGWAFQLQSPWFVALLVFLFFVMGLSLSGVYEFGGGLMGLGSGLTQSKGYKSSFFTGVLATVVASPCTAPFMGAALGFALAQPWLVAMLVFVALGLGMALPFLILSFSPALMRFMPKPGAWMETFKEFMAFPMYATALWLLWVLGIQVGINGMIAVAAAALLLALALWVLQKGQHAKVSARRVGYAFSLVMAVIALSVLRMPMLDAQSGIGQAANPAASQSGEAAEFEPFSLARLEELRNEGQPVLVNMTAAWCITCLANEQTTLGTAQVKNAMAEHGITYLKGDWTNQDPEITQMLDMYNRPSVPLYLLYSGDPSAEPRILPQLLTPSIVIDAFASI
jgi:thiol:disulfide interchange protein DsbD